MSKSLGDRMKGYENVERKYLMSRMPLLIRLDGKAFHTFTRGFQKPWDERFMSNMDDLAIFLCSSIQTVQLCYVQSDELSLLLHPYKKLASEPWFGNNLQKMVSVSAGYASSFFSLLYDSCVVFDSRAWVLPEAEVNNYFLWRQQDATRNAIQMLGQHLYSHKHLQGKSCSQIQEMLWQDYQINFNDFEPYYKRGRCILRSNDDWVVDRNIPIFSQDKNYIEQWLKTDED